MLELLNSLDTIPTIEKVSPPICFLAYLLSSLSEDPYLVQSEIILSFMYLQFNIDRCIPYIYVSFILIFPAQLGILERSILFFVLAPTFPNETKGMSHYDLDCILILNL